MNSYGGYGGGYGGYGGFGSQGYGGMYGGGFNRMNNGMFGDVESRYGSFSVYDDVVFVFCFIFVFEIVGSFNWRKKILGRPFSRSKVSSALLEV